MRSLPGKKATAPSGDKPDLAAILDHYGVKYSHSDRQKVRCPIHDDSSPSCSVNLSRGLWNCHGCQKGGDAITLVMEKEGISEFSTALRRCEEILGIGSGSLSGKSGGDSGGFHVGRVPRGQGVVAQLGGKRVPSRRRRPFAG